MTRLIGAALVAASTLLGASYAGAQTAPGLTRSSQGAFIQPAGRRCSGIGCLQNFPSLGVGF